MMLHLTKDVIYGKLYMSGNEIQTLIHNSWKDTKEMKDES